MKSCCNARGDDAGCALSWFFFDGAFGQGEAAEHSRWLGQLLCERRPVAMSTIQYSEELNGLGHKSSCFSR